MIFGYFRLNTRQKYSTYLVFSVLRTALDEVYCAKQPEKLISITYFQN